MSLLPSAVKATTEGVVLIPSAFSITLGAEPSITATHELVVPKSIPIILSIAENCLETVLKSDFVGMILENISTYLKDMFDA